MFMHRMLLSLSLALFAAVAAAQDRPAYGPDVGIEQAKKMAAGAIAEARKNNWNVAIAIVDNHGFLVYFERMDNTQTASVQIAEDKAKGAAMYRRPTRVFEEAVGKGRVAVLNLHGVSAITGGLPIMSGGKVIGGIGVSGVTSDQDEQCAKAGIAGM